MKRTKKAFLIFCISFLIFNLLGINFSQAITTTSQTWNAQADFEQGTADENADLESSEGDLKLKNNLNSYIEDDEEDFNDGFYNDTFFANEKIGLETNADISYSYSNSSTPSIGDETVVTASTLDLENNLLYIGIKYGGVLVFDTKGTEEQGDDEEIFRYTETSSPAIKNNYVNRILLDSENNILYVSTGRGLSMVKRNNVNNSGDDEVINYLEGFNITDCFIDDENNWLYVGDRTEPEGLNVIDRGVVSDLSDDLLIKNYNNSDLGTDYVNHSFVDSENNLVYVSTIDEGLVVIDRGDIENQEDDVVVKKYKDPDFDFNDSLHAFLDAENNLLYVSTYGGLHVINRNEVSNQNDDVEVKSYMDTYYITSSFVNSVDGFLYITDRTNAAGVTIIDRKTIDNHSDDEIIEQYSTESNPSIINDFVNYLFIDNDDLYISTDEGLSVIIRNPGGYSNEGSYISDIFNLGSTPSGRISFSADIPAETDVSIQTRTSGEGILWQDEFNDGNASNVSDYYNLGASFQSVSENNGILTMTDPEQSDFSYMYIDSGEDEDEFPAGSEVIVRARYTGESATNVNFQIGSDDWESGIDTILLPNGEWTTATLIPEGNPFSIIEFDTYWESGTWNSETDKIEIDWVRVESSDAWGEWSTPCTDQSGCSIPDTNEKTYLQYKLNLSTEDESITPEVDSVTLSDGYQPTATYTSNNLQFSQTTDLYNLTVEKDTPTNTNIALEYSLDDGNTWNPITLTDNSFTFSELTRATNFKWRAVLSTTDPGLTPILSSLTLNTSPSDLIVPPTEINEEAQKAKITSWKAYQYTDLKSKLCQNKLRVEIKGKYFDDEAQVKIGNKKAFDVDRKSSKRLNASFCYDKLLNTKTSLKKTLKVTNPNAQTSKAKKEINLKEIIPKFTPDDFNTQTTQGIKNVQTALSNLDYLDKQYITGNYDQPTQEAIKKFQADNNIPQTGYVGPLTKAKLVEKIN